MKNYSVELYLRTDTQQITIVNPNLTPYTLRPIDGNPCVDCFYAVSVGDKIQLSYFTPKTFLRNYVLSTIFLLI